MKTILVAIIVAVAFSACNNASNSTSTNDTMPVVSGDSAAKMNSGNMGTGMGTDSMGLMNKGSHDSLTSGADSLH
jgi:hypothetical protein